MNSFATPADLFPETALVMTSCMTRSKSKIRKDRQFFVTTVVSRPWADENSSRAIYAARTGIWIVSTRHLLTRRSVTSGVERCESGCVRYTLTTSFERWTFRDLPPANSRGTERSTCVDPATQKWLTLLSTAVSSTRV